MSSSTDTFTAIRKVLIANRGEIACRIIKSCKQLGLVSVAIYTPADRTSSHVALADEAWLLPGPDQSAYIEEDEVLAIANKSGSQAIIPGYGESTLRTFAHDRILVRERNFRREGRSCGSDMGRPICRGHS
jgi:acetyl/propionyl-CoA carboxylase alpha subunit